MLVYQMPRIMEIRFREFDPQNAESFATWHKKGNSCDEGIEDKDSLDFTGTLPNKKCGTAWAGMGLLSVAPPPLAEPPKKIEVPNTLV